MNRIYLYQARTRVLKGRLGLGSLIVIMIFTTFVKQHIKKPPS